MYKSLQKYLARTIKRTVILGGVLNARIGIMPLSFARGVSEDGV